MKHLIRFTSIALILLFAGTSTLVRTSERVRIEAVGWSPASFTQHLSPASPANLQGMPESQAATASTTERNKALVLKWPDALRSKDTATAQALDKSVADSGLGQEIVLLDEEFEDYRRRDQAGEQMLADDYIGVPVSGRTLDKAGTIELFRSGRMQTKSLKISGGKCDFMATRPLSSSRAT